MAGKPKTTRRKSNAKGPAPSERDLREAAFSCVDLAAAAAALGVPDLQAVLDAHKRLAAAWERGRLLRRVQDVATTTVVVPEAADRLLGLTRGTFVELYKRDRFVRDLWDRGRYAVMVEIERALVARVKEADPRAVTAVEHLFGHRGEPQTADFNRLTPTQMEAATGIKRQTILRWWKENGLPRNADETYSLPRFVAWRIAFEVDKVSRIAGTPGQDSLREQKARRAKIEADLLEERVFDKAKIVKLFTARAARMVQLLNAGRAKEWSHLHEGKTAGQLETDYLRVFNEIRSLWREFPPEVPMPEEAKRKIEEAIGLLMKETADDHQ